jgi:hypothetical protein
MNSCCRNQKYVSRIILMVALLLAAVFVYVSQTAEAANKSGSKGETPTEFLQGAISQNEVTDNLEKLGIKCIIHQEDAGISASNTLSVEKVRLGSSAYYGGVLAGDLIKDFHKLNANTFRLVIERSGKIYQVNLQTLSGQVADNPLSAAIKKDMLNGNISHQELSGQVANNLLSATAKKDVLNGNVSHQDLSGFADLKSADAKLGVSESTLIGNAQKTALASAGQNLLIPASIAKQDNGPTKKLLSYDIELIIDITGSMDWIDGTGDLSKFQWCHEQVRNLAQQLAPYHKTITITTFNTTDSTMERCDPEKVEQTYATIEPSGNTDLVDPLVDRLNAALIKHKDNGRPVLIVVITDGLPNVPRDPSVVNRALIDFTHQLRGTDEVIVTILQIGDTFDGRDFCVDLDDNLVNEGAKYDIVDTKTFAELKHKGLVTAMIDAVMEAHNNQHLSKKEKDFKRFVNSLPPSKQTSTKVDTQIRERENERKEIERQIFGQ